MYVEIHHLSFAYNQANPVIDDLSLTVKKGNIVALIGDSGSGKSTLLRLISGLEVPTSGEISLHQKTIYNQHTFVKPERRSVGMVFQDYALFPHMKVEKNIRFGISKLPKKDQDNVIDAVLHLVNLPHKKHSYPHALSGGEQQRVALARALAPHPNLLLLDEPFSNLDTKLKKQVRQDLKSILNKANTTCILVTHDIEDATTIADVVYYIENGKLNLYKV
ncbi:MAG: ABC transporter ATP-binding protein [Bacillota bacterium]